MAMNRTPPFGFGTATRPAPARTGATAGQARPCASRFTSFVRCCGPCRAALPHVSVALVAEKDRALRRQESCVRPLRRSLPGAHLPKGGQPSRQWGTVGLGAKLGGLLRCPHFLRQSPVWRRALRAFRSKPSRARLRASSRRCASFKGFRPTRGSWLSSQRLRRSPSVHRRKRSRLYAAAARRWRRPARRGAPSTH